MKYNHLNVPTHWRNYWTRYPEGHTILEALISWVSQVDDMVDNQNTLNVKVDQFRNEIDEFVERFDDRLQDEVTKTLRDWQGSGFLDVVISEALKWQLDDYITTNEQDKFLLNTQLAQTEAKKADRTEVRYKTDLIGLNDASPELLSAIQGGAGTSFDLKTTPKFSSVHIQTLSEIGKVNLFNKDKVTPNKYISNSGAILDHNELMLSEYIPVSENKTYTLSKGQTSPGGVFDSDYNWIAPIPNPTAITYPWAFTIPGGGAFVRLNIDTTINEFMFTVGSSIPSEYTPYGARVNWLKVDETNITPNSVSGAKLQDKSVTPSKVAGFKYDNLFNKDTITIDKYVNPSGQSVDLPGYSHSDYIPVEVGMTYALSTRQTTVGSFYNEKKEFISSLSTSEPSTYTFVVPEGVAYFRVNVNNLLVDELMMVEGSVIPDDYKSYGGSISWLKTTQSAGNKWKDKRIVTFGDSVTWYDGNQYGTNTKESGTTVKGYQYYMREELGATVINQGVSGNTMQQINARIKSYDFTAVDACTIMGGTNNYRDQEEGSLGNVLPLGSTFDENTFTGALQSSIEYILTSKADIKLFLLTPLKGWYASTEERTPMTTEIPDIIFEVAELYGLPVCDLYRNSGINELTESAYIVDSASVSFRFHPSTKGYKRMSEVINPFLLNH